MILREVSLGGGDGLAVVGKRDQLRFALWFHDERADHVQECLFSYSFLQIRDTQNIWNCF